MPLCAETEGARAKRMAAKATGCGTESRRHIKFSRSVPGSLPKRGGTVRLRWRRKCVLREVRLCAPDRPAEGDRELERVPVAACRALHGLAAREPRECGNGCKKAGGQTPAPVQWFPRVPGFRRTPD